jgi:hypothetical protein
MVFDAYTWVSEARGAPGWHGSADTSSSSSLIPRAHMWLLLVPAVTEEAYSALSTQVFLDKVLL